MTTGPQRMAPGGLVCIVRYMLTYLLTY